MRQSLKLKWLVLSLAISLLLVAVTVGSWGQRARAQSPQLSDPDYDSRIGNALNWPAAAALIDQIETTGQPRRPNYEAVKVGLLDDGADFSHPDLQGQGELVDLINLITPSMWGHGTAMAGGIAALENGQYIATPGGLYPGRVQVLAYRCLD